uniref:RING-type E3 ubiquitin transferase n=1 Tax=Mesocestoides corti TaxID=53468 RepID=A0A5K3EQQ3_MESCO
MGLRISSGRVDSTGGASTAQLSPHHRHRQSGSPSSGARNRSLSRNRQQAVSDEPGPSSGRRFRRNHGHTPHHLPSFALFDRLVADIEANGGVISPDDPRIIRLLRAYHPSSSESGEGGNRARPISVLETDGFFSGIMEAPTGRSHRSRRSGGRHRGSVSASPATTEDESLEERLSAVRRQVLLSLAAASSSSPHRRRQWPESLLLLSGRDRPCVFCKRVIPHDDYDLHYVMCLTRPRVTYNEDTLQSDKGECAICLEDMKAGDLIARLPCLYLPQKVHRRLVPKKANLSRTPRRLGACESRIVLNFTSFVVKNNMHCGCIDTLEPRAKSSSVHNIITPPFHFRISLRHICSSQEHPRCLLTWPVRARDGSGQLFSFFHFHRLDELSLDELFSLKCERSVVAYMFYLKYLINWHPYPK